MRINLDEIVEIATIEATLPALVKAGKLPSLMEGPVRLAIEAVAAIQGANAVSLHVEVSIVPVKTA